MSIRAILILGFGLFLTSLAVAQQPDSGLRIEIISAETRRPIEGVSVTVTPREGPSLTGLTAADGVIEFGSLDAGLYSVTAARAALRMATEPSVRVIRRKVTPLRLELRVEEDLVLEEVVVRARIRGRGPRVPRFPLRPEAAVPRPRYLHSPGDAGP